VRPSSDQTDPFETMIPWTDRSRCAVSRNSIEYTRWSARGLLSRLPTLERPVGAHFPIVQQIFLRPIDVGRAKRFSSRELELNR
jgi:hypothetical protein